MAEKKKPTEEKEDKTENKLKTCFVIMPISDSDGYDAGHFKRVYEHIIKPACYNAGFEPLRADDINTTNHIIIDILKHTVEADMALCDLSSRNPNVLYELGIRQAFNLPVTLIKDERTSRIFDIQTLRDVSYDSSLRIDKIEQAIPEITSALQNTYNDKVENINSIVQLLGIEAAKVTKTEISEDTGLILDAINALGKRLSRVEDRSNLGSVDRLGLGKSQSLLKSEEPQAGTEIFNIIRIRVDTDKNLSEKEFEAIENAFKNLLDNPQIIRGTTVGGYIYELFLRVPFSRLKARKLNKTMNTLFPYVFEVFDLL